MFSECCVPDPTMHRDAIFLNLHSSGGGGGCNCTGEKREVQSDQEPAQVKAARGQGQDLDTSLFCLKTYTLSKPARSQDCGHTVGTK